MSATITAFPKRERTYRPDIAQAFDVIDTTDGSLGELFALAKTALRGCEVIRERHGGTPEACQGIANGLGVAFLALATMLGLPRAEAEEALSGDGGGQ